MRASKNLLAILVLGLLSSMLLPLQANASVSRNDGVRFISEYQSALRNKSLDGLSALIADNARIRIDLDDNNGQQQRFTLSRERFIQQIVALWRFASDQRQDFSNPQYVTSANGTLTLTVTQTEQRRLFGSNTGQKDTLTMVLERRNGRVQIVDLHSVSQLW